MMMKRTIYLCLVGLWLASCGAQQEANMVSTDGLVRLALNDLKESGAKNLPMDNIKILPLEAKKGALVGEISKVMYAGGRYHILDRNVVKGVLVFDDQGKFLFKIRKRGRGPGEYAECYDMEVDPEGNIYVMDVNGRKIIKYGNDGRFVEEHPYGFFSAAFSKVAQDTFALYQFKGVNAEEATHFDLMYWTTQQHLTKRYFPYEPITGSRETYAYQYFYKTPEATLFNTSFCDTIYDVTRQGLQAKYVLDFGKYAPPPSAVQNKEIDDLIKVFKNNSYVWKQSNFFESNQHFLGSFSLDGNIGLFKYDKGAKQVSKYNMEGMKWPDFWSAMPMGMVDDNTYYGYLVKDQIRFIKDHYEPGRDKLIELLHQQTPEMTTEDVMNPFILTYNIAS